MGRPRNSLNVTEADRERIRQLYRDGVRVAEIATRIGRGESAVYGVVNSQKLKRPRPRPKPRTTRRDELIAQRVLVEDLSPPVVARRFRLTATRVCQIVKAARHAATATGQSKVHPTPAAPPARSSRRTMRRATAQPEQPTLTSQQRVRRDHRIAKLVLGEGVSKAAVARRFGISVSTVARIVKIRAGSRP